MGVQIKGLSSLKAKTKKAPKIISQGVVNATHELTDIVHGYAVQNVQSSVKHGSGELAGSIKTEVAEAADSQVAGRIWTDKKQGVFRELGTGPVGEASTKNLPPGITPVYTQTPWFIPASEVPDLEELYGMLRITIQGVDYFRTSGQPARPWLYPALLEGQKQAPEIVQKHVKQSMKGLK